MTIEAQLNHVKRILEENKAMQARILADTKTAENNLGSLSNTDVNPSGCWMPIYSHQDEQSQELEDYLLWEK